MYPCTKSVFGSLYPNFSVWQSMYFLETAICKNFATINSKLVYNFFCLFVNVISVAIITCSLVISLPVHQSCQFQSHDLLDQPAYSEQNNPAHFRSRDPKCSFPPTSPESPTHNHSTYRKESFQESFYCHYIRNFIIYTHVHQNIIDFLIAWYLQNLVDDYIEIGLNRIFKEDFSSFFSYSHTIHLPMKTVMKNQNEELHFTFNLKTCNKYICRVFLSLTVEISGAKKL